MLLVSQYRLFSRLSSGSVFSAELPRYVVMLFNWAFGTILLAAVFQICVDMSTLLTAVIRRECVKEPVSLRYGIGATAMILVAVGVR